MSDSHIHKTSLDQKRWDAVVARDGKTAGSFVYGVLSTKIFCLPTCSARVKGRASVVFFDTPDVAHEHGFRACRKCNPAGVLEDQAGR